MDEKQRKEEQRMSKDAQGLKHAPVSDGRNGCKVARIYHQRAGHASHYTQHVTCHTQYQTHNSSGKTKGTGVDEKVKEMKNSEKVGAGLRETDYATCIPQTYITQKRGRQQEMSTL